MDVNDLADQIAHLRSEASASSLSWNQRLTYLRLIMMMKLPN